MKWTGRRKMTIASFASLEAMAIRKTINIQLIVRMVIFLRRADVRGPASDAAGFS